MSDRPGKPERDRWATLMTDEERTMDTICSHVSNGGTLVTLAETWAIPFGWVSNWIHKDDTRNKRYIQALNDRAEWGAEVVLRELRRIGLSDIRKLYNDDGSLKPVSQWDEDTAKAVAGLEIDQLFESSGQDRTQIGYTKKVKTFDKIAALKLIGTNLSLFMERHHHSGTVTLADLVTASQEPEKKNG